MVEVFKTNVAKQADAENLLKLLSQELPGCRCNFDLEDCDKIFRLEACCDLSNRVIAFFARHHFQCEVL